MENTWEGRSVEEYLELIDVAVEPAEAIPAPIDVICDRQALWRTMKYWGFSLRTVLDMTPVEYGRYWRMACP